MSAPPGKLDSVLVIEKNRDFFPLNLVSSLLKDNTGRLTIDSVVKPGMPFEPIRHEILEFVNDPAEVYWFRCTIDNRTGLPLQDLFCLQPGLDTLDFYLFKPDGSIIHSKSSSLQMTRARHFFISHELVTPAVLQPGVNRIYLRIANHSGRSRELSSLIASISDERSFLNYFLEFRFYQGIAIGMLLLILVLHIFIYGFLRDPTYLVFSINIFFTVVYLILRKNYQLEFDFLSPYYGWLTDSHDIVQLLILITAIWFTQTFLNTTITDRWMHRSMNILMICFGVGITSIIFRQALGLVRYLSIYASFISAVLMMVASVRSYLKGNRLALYVFFGFLALSFIPAIYLFPTANYLHFRSSESNFNYFGEALLSAIFAVGVAHRFYFIKKEASDGEIEKRQLLLNQAKQLQQEKERISRDLHDNIGSQLTVLSLDLHQLSHELDGNARVGAVQESALSIIGQLRDTVWVLENNHISMDEMEIRLNTLLWDYRKSTSGVEFILETSLILRPLLFKPQQAINLYRVIQEAIQNAVRHGASTRVTIQLATQADGAALVAYISDNGKGFVVNSNGSSAGGHYGLRNMKKRAQVIDGELEITSGNNSGTVVSLVFPLDSW